MARPVPEEGDWSGLRQQVEPPVAPIGDGRAIPIHVKESRDGHDHRRSSSRHHGGVGPDTAAALLVAVGDNPERLHSEAAWAHLCGVSPIPAGSGRSAGHLRLHKGGDRQANSALWRIVMVRIAHDPETTHYFERRVKEGRTKRDVIRILKRYVAREVYKYLPRG